MVLVEARVLAVVEISVVNSRGTRRASSSSRSRTRSRSRSSSSKKGAKSNNDWICVVAHDLYVQ